MPSDRLTETHNRSLTMRDKTASLAKGERFSLKFSVFVQSILQIRNEMPPRIAHFSGGLRVV